MSQNNNDEKDLIELLSMLDSFNPVLPESLLDYHFTRAGLQCDDVRLKKLIALITQKFITDVAGDALAHQKLRTSVTKSSNSKKTVLALEDLTAALAERGVDVKRPFYHI